MGTTLVVNNKRNTNISKLTEQQQMFVLELLSDKLYNITEAARRAGYKNPSQAANKLLKNKLVQRALGKAKAQREERVGLSADQVLAYLKNALFFNPLQYFKPTADGGWLITDPDSLPEEIGCLIEEMQVKVVELEDGKKQHYFKVRFVSHATALALAMKHVSVDKSEVIHKLDWDSVLSTQETESVIRRLEAEESKSKSKRG